jgi:hypothetical protein
MEPVATKGKLSEEERERILEQMRRELPELDRRYEKAISNLDRISRGLRPKALTSVETELTSRQTDRTRQPIFSANSMMIPSGPRT